jgi:hypothetical protein
MRPLSSPARSRLRDICVSVFSWAAIAESWPAATTPARWKSSALRTCAGLKRDRPAQAPVALADIERTCRWRPKPISGVAVLTQAISAWSWARSVRSSASSEEEGGAASPTSVPTVILAALLSRGVHHKPPLRPSHSPSRRLWRTSQKTRDPVHRTAKQNVR